MLNSRDSIIKFTFELEEDGKLSFLDSLIVKQNNVLEIDVYREDIL